MAEPADHRTPGVFTEGKVPSEPQIGSELPPPGLDDRHPPTLDLSHRAIPAERVRFNTFATVAGHGYERAKSRIAEGAVLNLSRSGVACALPAGFDPGERAWISFRPSLAEEALDLPCEVVWRREDQAVGAVYGFRFTKLDAQEASRIAEVVHERCEGRAAAWPLPVVMPQTPPERGQRRPAANPYILVTAGMAAGITLTLALLSVLGVQRYPSPLTLVPLQAPEKQAQAGPAELSGTHDGESPSPGTSPQDDAARALPAQPGEKPVEDEATAEEIQPTVQLPRAVTEGSVSEGTGLQPIPPEPPSPEEPRAPLPNTTAEGVELLLPTNGAVEEYQAFWLETPQRLVVDVPNRQSILADTDYPLDHEHLLRVRVGQHPNKVRFVVETAETVLPEFAARPSAQGLVVILRLR